MYKKFVFVKEFKCPFGLIKPESTLSILNHNIYFNDGQITPVHYDIFYNLIIDEVTNNTHKYLREVPIPYNKL